MSAILIINILMNFIIVSNSAHELKLQNPEDGMLVLLKEMPCRAALSQMRKLWGVRGEIFGKSDTLSFN